MVVSLDGTPLSWTETKNLSNNYREVGIKQYINLLQRWHDRDGDPFKWGEEIEYSLVKLDDQHKKARLSLCAPQLIKVLNEKQKENPDSVRSSWSGEFASYMIEASPSLPYEGLATYMNLIESNLADRRKEIRKYLPKDEAIMTLSDFPLLGAQEFTWPIYKPHPERRDSIEHSNYLPDEVYATPLHVTVARNLRERRGENVTVHATVFKDVNTQIPVDGAPADKPDAVYMDAMGFGFGCGSLQVTFQASNLDEARVLHDQLAPLCPIMLALTAASPVFRGYLVDSDCRWNIICAASDCRTAGERGEGPLGEHEKFIPRSRCDSINSYISTNGENYNDVPVVYDEKDYENLRNAEVDHLMAQHIAQLFLRDVLAVFEEEVDQVNEEGTDHVELVLKENWPTIKLKPPLSSTLGWRVEFRPCELQITDFENAAIACFMALLARITVIYNLNFLIPISKLDENMQTAQKRNACTAERFWFRKEIFGKPRNNQRGPIDNEFVLLTIDQIMNGNGSWFLGLIPLMKRYLTSMDIDFETRNTIKSYLGLIQQRASGGLMTTASWIRKEITSHPEYKKDSIVSDRINFDLLKNAQEIQEGRPCSELHGSLIQFKLNLR